jgi:hypothetical protein
VQHYSLLAANIAGHSKKTVVMGTITMMSALGGFSGPWAYKGDQAERGYPDGQIATLSLFAVSVGSYVCLWYVYPIHSFFFHLSVRFWLGSHFSFSRVR